MIRLADRRRQPVADRGHPAAVGGCPPDTDPRKVVGRMRFTGRRTIAIAATEESRMTTSGRLEPGVLAPEFTLVDADGIERSLSDYRGSRVIVYFYPAAMTPGCTKEACDFRDNLASLDAAGLAVIGISPDPPAKLAKFRDKEGLTFPLLSDPDRKVLTVYRAYGEKQLYGRTVTGVIRSTFVIDADGRIEQAQYNVKATGHVAKLRRDLGL
jgi:peroxiredoxin Q/BCP